MGEEDMEKLAEKLGISLEQAFTTAVKNVPQKRMSDPGEIAAICVFLASDEAPYMTGSVVVADGGASIVDPAMLAFQK
jgi:NAD(P)-dependent dehydrogenase (short-subunit alcohol dehydrogenase family)